MEPSKPLSFNAKYSVLHFQESEGIRVRSGFDFRVDYSTDSLTSQQQQHHRT